MVSPSFLNYNNDLNYLSSFDCRSDEALELSQIIKKLGLNKDICSEEYLFKFFETFYAQKNNI